MRRLFLALKMPELQEKELEEFIMPYKSHPALKEAKWIPSGSHHMTTLFLGEVPDNLVAEVQAFARGVCAKIPYFTLTPKRVSLYPEKGMAKMIWLKFERSLEFQELCSELLRFIKPSLPDLEVKESIAHLSIARFRTHIPGESLSFKPVTVSPFEVTESVLFESKITPEGTVYTELERYPHDVY